MKLISILIPYYKENQRTFVWCQQRGGHDNLSGLLEFPGGKIEAKETPELAAIREVLEETGISLKLEQIQRLGSFEFDDLTIFVHIFEDLNDLFSESGYHVLSYLIENKGKILPNNESILNEFDRFLRDFKEIDSL